MTQPKNEVRSFQLRAKSDAFVLEGYAATFGTESDDLGGYKEIIAPGAFSRSLAAKKDIHATVQHNFSALLGRTKNGSLILSEDTRGLSYSIQLDKNSALHKETYNNVKSGLLDECSFIFTVQPEGQVWSADGKTRTLTDVDLIEVSIVALPAYPGTSADARSLATADSAALLAKVLAMPGDWKRQERAHELGLEIARAAEQRSDTHDSEPLTEEDFTAAQEALIERFGRSANGHAPKHWLLDMDNSRCRTLHMDTQQRCSIPYSVGDEGDHTFGDVEPDDNEDYGTGERCAARLATARQIVADESLRTRMAIAAGRR